MSMNHSFSVCIALAAATLTLSCGTDLQTRGAFRNKQDLSVCGNNKLEDDEACDGTDFGGKTCQTEGYASGTLRCTACAVIDPQLCIAGALCGNGEIDPGEECDGTIFPNNTAPDCSTQGPFEAGKDVGCRACRRDLTECRRLTCGNDKAEGAEFCDGSDLRGVTCEDQGYTGGTLACASSCNAFDESGCTNQICGDDSADGNETCDGSDLNGESCANLGFTAGTLSCNNSCDGFDTSACTTCGNNTREGSEVCDGTDLAGQTCTSIPGNYTGGTLGCATACGSFDTSACTENLCGNGQIDPGEECDGSNLNGWSCGSDSSEGGEGPTPEPTCDANCKINCATCGGTCQQQIGAF